MNKFTLLFVFLFFGVHSMVAQVQLTADINPGNSPSNANDFAVYNNKLYFLANDGNVGNELFVYDGVTVSLVADINPGTANSFPGGFTVFNNNLYFRADDGTTGSELFVYDGTSVTLAADINPGTSSSSPYELTVYNNNLYFRANTPFFGNEFWVYDGTTASIVSDIRPSGSSSPSFLTVYNNKLYFSANNGVTGSELWEYDGSTTSFVQDIRPGPLGSNPRDLTVYNNNLYFEANDGSSGSELFVYNGTTTSLVADIRPGTLGSSSIDFAVYNNKLFFRANDGNNGAELWEYDGTNVSLVADINPGTANSNLFNLTIFNNKLYFTADNGSAGYELWVYDGLTASLVDDYLPGIGSSSPIGLIVYGNTLYFQARDVDGTNGPNIHGTELCEYSPCSTTFGTDVISECDSYTWIDGNTYTASNNTATFTLTNAAGCDSIVTLDLTINNSNTGTDVQTACDSYTWIDGNTYTASNNTATWTLTNVAGCDSVVTLDLTINNSNTGIDVVTECDSYTWIDGNTYAVSNNTATWTLTNAAGCDSIVTLDLTINNSNTGTDVITACDSYTWIDGNTYTASNSTATFTLTNAAGCDSIVTLDLTINNSNTGTDVQTACDSYTWIDGNTYTASNNTATFTLTNAAGCDSIVTLDLTINNSNTGTDVITACDTYTWIDGNTYTSDNNTAMHTLTNIAGCDSVVTLDLTINNSNTGTDVITACDTYTWIDGNSYTSDNNTATHTLTNVAGCDSVVTLDLTINNSNTGTDVITECDSYTWIDGNTYTSSNNTATHTLTNVAGCDSVVTLDLTINNSNTGIDVVTECDSYTWIDGNTYTADNNTATFTLTNAAGCDSIVTLDLTIEDITAPIADVTSLSDLTDECEITALTAPTATDNCVSVVTGTHNITLPITSTTTITWTYDDGNGNTSTQTQEVIITPIDNGVSVVNDISLSADASGYTYQWIDCNDNNSPIAGETNQTFEATENGSYAVIIDNGDCSVTSDCFDITTVSLNKSEIEKTTIFPNPTADMVTISSSNGFSKVEVVNTMGQLLFSVNLNQAKTYQLHLPETKGVYLIKVSGNDDAKTFKIIKE